jgi:uncharacterized membrane protein
MTSYKYEANLLSTLVCVMILAFFLWVGRRNIGASNKKKTAMILELVRGVLVLGILFSLMNPMEITKKRDERKPIIKVLRDISASMQTEDVYDSKGQLISRLKQMMQDATDEKFAELSGAYEFEVIDFDGRSGSEEATDIAAALESVLKNDDRLRGVLLLSDGTWNTGENPLDLAEMSKVQGVPIYSVSFGDSEYLADLKFEFVERPSFGLVKEKIVIPFVVRNYLSTEFNGQVRLHAGSVNLVKSVTIPAGGTISDHFLWQPLYAGDFKFTMELPIFNNEVNKLNNKLEFGLNVREEVLKVLVIESLPRWEYRYMRNAMNRDPGVEVETYLMHQGDMKLGDGEGYLKTLPTTIEGFSKYDVIFLGDVGMAEGQLTKEQLKLIRGLVEEQGSGLVFLPGMIGQQVSLMESPLGELLPVVYDRKKPEGIAYSEETQFELSSIGSEHMLTMLADTTLGNYALWKILPGFYWAAAVQRVKAGTQVLATHSLEKMVNDDAMPILAIASRGNGQVLFLGTDSAWRWRRGVEDKYHYRFWGQVVRWMSNSRHAAYSENVRLFLSPAVLHLNGTMNLQATIFDGSPLDKREVEVVMTGPDGNQHKFNLHQKEMGWGTYKGDFKLDQAGEWDLDLMVKNSSISYQKKISVGGRVLEQKGLPASLPVMRKLAAMSGGKYFISKDFDMALNQIDSLPQARVQEIRWRLLSQWWWGLSLVVLACAYWILRKRQGLI